MSIDHVPAKAVLYARCSTDESRQDVEVQLGELRRYAQAYGWAFDEAWEYDSGFRGEQSKLKAILEDIRLKRYNIFLIYSLDRFSRRHPRWTNARLDEIVYDYGCRFITLKEGIDSQNEFAWNCVKGLFSYFAHVFSQQLSAKIKDGIRRKRELGVYRGGRPQKPVDRARLLTLRQQGLSLRQSAGVYNEGKSRRERLSYVQVKRVLQKVSAVSPTQTGV